jgi:hypothetical protein
LNQRTDRGGHFLRRTSGRRTNGEEVHQNHEEKEKEDKIRNKKSKSMSRIRLALTGNLWRRSSGETLEKRAW